MSQWNWWTFKHLQLEEKSSFSRHISAHHSPERPMLIVTSFCWLWLCSWVELELDLRLPTKGSNIHLLWRHTPACKGWELTPAGTCCSSGKGWVSVFLNWTKAVVNDNMETPAEESWGCWFGSWILALQTKLDEEKENALSHPMLLRDKAVLLNRASLAAPSTRTPAGPCNWFASFDSRRGQSGSSDS